MHKTKAFKIFNVIFHAVQKQAILFRAYYINLLNRVSDKVKQAGSFYITWTSIVVDLRVFFRMNSGRESFDYSVYCSIRVLNFIQLVSNWKFYRAFKLGLHNWFHRIIYYIYYIYILGQSERAHLTYVLCNIAFHHKCGAF